MWTSVSFPLINRTNEPMSIPLMRPEKRLTVNDESFTWFPNYEQRPPGLIVLPSPTTLTPVGERVERVES